jgi:DNA repair protein RadD
VSVDPRDIYQARMEQETYDAWNAGARGVVAVLPTGGGKSVYMTNIAYKENAQGIWQCTIAHRTELTSQMSMHYAARGIKHRIIAPKNVVADITAAHRKAFNGYSFINPDAIAAVAAIDTLMARREALAAWAQQIERVKIDECFPAGTQIKTAYGSKLIETVKVGDNVLAFDERSGNFETRKVLKLFKNPAPNIMFDILTNGCQISATAGHPFWTRRGWIEAKDLKSDDDLYIYMRSVRYTLSDRERASKLSFQKDRFSILQNIVRNDVSRCSKKAAKESGTRCQTLHGVQHRTFTHRKDMFQNMSSCCVVRNNVTNQSRTCFSTHDRAQSNASIGKSGQDERNSASKETQTINTRRQRQDHTFGGMLSYCDVGTDGFCTSIQHQNLHETRKWFSLGVQTGYGAPNFKNCDRSGWLITQHNCTQRSRSKKRYIFVWSRVESVALQKCANTDRTSDGFVYNIEVDEYHTYVANDIVVHNCHHVLRANKWGRGVEMFPRARLLGVTASPTRADGQGLGRHADGVFDVMIQGPDMRSLINMGALCEYHMVCPTSDLEVSDDDFNTEGELSPRRGRLASKRSHIVGDVVKEYFKYALGKRTIVFTTDVETATEIATNFNLHGIRAAAVNGETDPAVRREYIERFRDGRLDVLVNVDLFGEGFDVPACECVIMARPTNSLAVYLQQFGRALRLMPGKAFGLIIDMVSNYKRHGFPDKPHYWTLDRQEKRAKREKDPEEIELTRCRECDKPYERFYVACPHCGAEPPVPAGGVRSLEKVDGDLTYLSADVLAQMRAAAMLVTPAAAAAGVPASAPAHAATGAAYRAMERWAAQARLDAAFAQYAGCQRAKGRDDRETNKRLYLTLGVSVLEARGLPRADMEKIAERVEGWCK